MGTHTLILESFFSLSIRHIDIVITPETRLKNKPRPLLDANHLYKHFASYASCARINGSVRGLHKRVS